MADDSQMKMEALKKVYAEVIMNTSKEAAARVMAAECKALSFQQQLVSLKEESLNMLLRLKDHFNSMLIEAEARSLKQEMKIEELEAQLCEAEGIIVDLRDEFNQVQEHLEIMRQTQEKPLSNNHILVTNEPVQECAPQDNVPHSFISQVSDTNSVLVDNEKKAVSLHTTAPYRFFQDINDADLSTSSHLNQLHAPNDDCSSIIMQNRETDLCRNGSTQRICAFQGNLPNVMLPSSQSEDPKNLLNVQSTTNAEETLFCRQHENDSVNIFSKTNQSNVKNIPLRQLSQHSSCYEDQAVKSLRRSTRKNAKYREAIASLQGSRKKFEKTRLQHIHGPLKRCSSVVNVPVEFPMGVVEMDPKKIKVCCVSESDDLNLGCNFENVACAGEGNGAETREDSWDKSHTVTDGALQDSVLVDVPIAKGFGSSHCQLLKNVVCAEEGNGTKEALIDKSHTIPDDALQDSLLIDVPISEEFGSSHCPLAGRDRVLKFTFHRKRRKTVLGKIDENILHDRDTPKRGLENPTDVAVMENGISKMKCM
ncbi:uncharacterized protein LOC110735241 [Chenopodium quinoa]|uniref:Uncharacterized protein n=1 Tax=Chenopodium quinoa TaxID=63459 RepID=A0A803LSY4_CHEQI|nr:uncharacterized protein LOC110735241 [Chenopodium quinoa]